MWVVANLTIIVPTLGICGDGETFPSCFPQQQVWMAKGCLLLYLAYVLDLATVGSSGAKNVN